jgi:hypothetical protein
MDNYSFSKLQLAIYNIPNTIIREKSDLSDTKSFYLKAKDSNKNIDFNSHEELLEIGNNICKIYENDIFHEVHSNNNFSKRNNNGILEVIPNEKLFDNYEELKRRILPFESKASIKNLKEEMIQEIFNIKKNADLNSKKTKIEQENFSKHLLSIYDESIIRSDDFTANLIKENEEFRDKLMKTQNTYSKVNIEQRETVSKLAQSSGESLDKIQELQSSIYNIEVQESTLADKINSRVKNLDDFVNEKKEQIEKTIDILTLSTTSDQYIKKSSSERKSAEIMRILSLTFLILAISFSVFGQYFGIYSPVGDLAPIIENTLFSKLSIFLTFSVAAAYLARESAKHREKHYIFHQAALDIQSLDAYTRDLKDEEKRSIRINLVNDIFGQGLHNRNQSLKNEFPISIQEILIKAMDMISNNSNLEGKKVDHKNDENKRISNEESSSKKETA